MKTRTFIHESSLIFPGLIGQRKELSSSGEGSFPRERDEAILPAISRQDFFSSFVAIRVIRGPRSFMLELFEISDQERLVREVLFRLDIIHLL